MQFLLHNPSHSSHATKVFSLSLVAYGIRKVLWRESTPDTMRCKSAGCLPSVFRFLRPHSGTGVTDGKDRKEVSRPLKLRRQYPLHLSTMCP